MGKRCFTAEQTEIIWSYTEPLIGKLAICTEPVLWHCQKSGHQIVVGSGDIVLILSCSIRPFEMAKGTSIITFERFIKEAAQFDIAVLWGDMICRRRCHRSLLMPLKTWESSKETLQSFEYSNTWAK